MATARRGSKKTTARKTSGKKAPAKKTAAKQQPSGKSSSSKRNADAKPRARSFTKGKRDAAIAAAVALAAAGAAVAASSVRRSMTAARAMTAARTTIATASSACTIVNRGDVSAIVVTYIRELGFPRAAEGSDFVKGVPTTESARRIWAGDLIRIVEQRGCNVSDDFGPDQCAEAKKIRDIVDSLWDAVKTANAIEEA
jgi:hypothetical protein